MKLDTRRLAEPVTIIAKRSAIPDSGVGKLVRWFCYVYNTSISSIERRMGMAPSMLNQNIRLREKPLSGSFPLILSRWLTKTTHVRITADEIQLLSTMGGSQWRFFAKQIQEKLS